MSRSIVPALPFPGELRPGGSALAARSVCLARLLPAPRLAAALPARPAMTGMTTM